MKREVVVCAAERPAKASAIVRECMMGTGLSWAVNESVKEIFLKLHVERV